MPFFHFGRQDGHHLSSLPRPAYVGCRSGDIAQPSSALAFHPTTLCIFDDHQRRATTSTRTVSVSTTASSCVTFIFVMVLSYHASMANIYYRMR